MVHADNYVLTLPEDQILQATWQSTEPIEQVYTMHCLPTIRAPHANRHHAHTYTHPHAYRTFAHTYVQTLTCGTRTPYTHLPTRCLCSYAGALSLVRPLMCHSQPKQNGK